MGGLGMEGRERGILMLVVITATAKVGPNGNAEFCPCWRRELGIRHSGEVGHFKPKFWVKGAYSKNLCCLLNLYRLIFQNIGSGFFTFITKHAYNRHMDGQI